MSTQQIWHIISLWLLFTCLGWTINNNITDWYKRSRLKRAWEIIWLIGYAIVVIMATIEFHRIFFK